VHVKERETTSVAELCAQLGRPLPDDGNAAHADQVVADHVACARAAWPDVTLDEHTFTVFLLERVAADAASLDAGLAQLRVEELSLTCACAHGDVTAIRRLERDFFHNVDTALARLGRTGSERDEAKQALREKLFVGQPPKIASYSGLGGLGRWLWVTTVRDAVRSGRRDRNERPLPEEPDLQQLPSLAHDPEIEYIKKLYQDQFGSAFAEAMRALSAADRNLLRYHFLDGLSIDEIGAIYRIHRATAARRLTKVRELLMAGTRGALIARLQVDDGQVQSIIRLIRSQLDLSIRRHLSSEPAVAVAD